MRHCLRLALVSALSLVTGACVQRPRMCGAPTECGASAACVAGRCLPNGGVPAIQTARRLVVDPVDVAYLRPGEGASGGALPETFSLGRAGEEGAILYLRFAVPLARDSNVLEAYLLFERSGVVDVDPVPITVHAARVVEPWSGRFVSWLAQPRVEDTESPSTTIRPLSRGLVRIDVRDLVARWRSHEPDDQGIAVVADTTSPTGLVFSLGGEPGQAAFPLPPPRPPAPRASGGVTAAETASASTGVPVPSPTAAKDAWFVAPARSGPRLEVYLK